MTETILIVDDNIDNLAVAQILLEGEGFDVVLRYSFDEFSFRGMYRDHDIHHSSAPNRQDNFEKNQRWRRNRDDERRVHKGADGVRWCQMKGHGEKFGR